MELTEFLKDPVMERFYGLWQLVGNTPLIRLGYRFRGGDERFIYAKCEHYNLTGSIKDRMALYILQQAYRQELIAPGDRIVEATSGNTGIAFAAIGKALGHQVQIIMPDWLSRERIDIIQSLGAEIRLVSKAEGGFLGSIRLAEEAALSGGVFLPRQFENEFNSLAHQVTTGPEIWRDLQHYRLKPDAFIAGVGTGGTIMGVGSYLRRMDPAIKVHPLEPAESPTLSTGYKCGSHRIQGISDEFIPAIVRLGELDAVVQAQDGDAVLMAQALAATLGLAVGISSGANIIGAIRLQQEMGAGAVVVTVLPDDNKKYLSTALTRAEPIRPGYLTPDIQLTRFTSLPKK